MKITITNRDGSKQILEGDDKSTLMETIRDAGLDVEAACGGCCACATCHVYINQDWVDKLNPKEDTEEDMLDFAFDVKDNSRLSCQISVTDELDGLIVDLPEKQF